MDRSFCVPERESMITDINKLKPKHQLLIRLGVIGKCVDLDVDFISTHLKVVRHDAMCKIERTLNQLRIGIIFLAFRQMRYKTRAHDDMCPVVGTHDRFTVSR